jgi:hypothetical protein
MANYFDFIKKPTTNATANPPAEDDKAKMSNGRMTNNNSITMTNNK